MLRGEDYPLGAVPCRRSVRATPGRAQAGKGYRRVVECQRGREVPRGHGVDVFHAPEGGGERATGAHERQPLPVGDAPGVGKLLLEHPVVVAVRSDVVMHEQPHPEQFGHAGIKDPVAGEMHAVDAPAHGHRG